MGRRGIMSAIPAEGTGYLVRHDGSIGRARNTSAITDLVVQQPAHADRHDVGRDHVDASFARTTTMSRLPAMEMSR